MTERTAIARRCEQANEIVAVEFVLARFGQPVTAGKKLDPLQR